VSGIDGDRLYELARRLADVGGVDAVDGPPRYVSELAAAERARAGDELREKRNLVAEWQRLTEPEREWVRDTAARIRGMRAMYSNVIAEATWLGTTEEERERCGE
jgi:hypothetical protein